jgi:hypothetical protein
MLTKICPDIAGTVSDSTVRDSSTSAPGTLQYDAVSKQNAATTATVLNILNKLFITIQQ